MDGWLFTRREDERTGNTRDDVPSALGMDSFQSDSSNEESRRRRRENEEVEVENGDERRAGGGGAKRLV